MTRSLRQRTLYEIIRDIVEGKALPYEIRELLDMDSMDLYALRTGDSNRVEHGDRPFTAKLDLKRFRKWLEKNAPEHLERLDAAVTERAIDGEKFKTIEELEDEGYTIGIDWASKP